MFSEPDFFNQNIARIEYAIHQAIEDTKLQKKKMRADRAYNKTKMAGTIAGVTAATFAVGGIAAATFPMVFAATAGALVVSDKIESLKGQQHNLENISRSKRASSKIVHSKWVSEAFEDI